MVKRGEERHGKTACANGHVFLLREQIYSNQEKYFTRTLVSTVVPSRCERGTI